MGKEGSKDSRRFNGSAGRPPADTTHNRVSTPDKKDYFQYYHLNLKIFWNNYIFS